MSYKKMMKWNKRHPKGTRQPVIMHTNSGFWPSGAFLEDYYLYREKCEALNVEPVSCEEYYKRGAACNEELRKIQAALNK